MQKLYNKQSIKLEYIIHVNLTAGAGEFPVMICIVEMKSSWNSSQSHYQNLATHLNYAQLP